MDDRFAVLVGVLILVLGVFVLFTPEEFKVRLEFLPLSVAGTVVVALGMLVLVVGLISFFGRRL